MLFRLARVALAAVLLAAWQAALQHPIEHVDGLGELVHVHAGHPHDDEPQAGSRCDLLAALTACAAPSLPPSVHFQSGYESPFYPTSAPRVAEAPPFLSHGPPVQV